MQKPGAWIAAYVLVGLIGVLRVAATHRVFSETLDEPAHVAAGYDWIHGVPYQLDASHPPLARILMAIPLRMQNIPRPPEGNFVHRGNEILYHADRYEKNLARARFGNLLLLILGLVSVAGWATRLFGRPVGLLAMAMYASMPPILAHAGVATTDNAVAATLPFALWMLDRWIERRTWQRAVVLGVAIGLGLLSKFSFALFFPIGAAIVLAFRLRKSGGFATALPMSVVAIFVLWAGYQFDFGTIAKAHERGAEYAKYLKIPKAIVENVPVPAPLFFVGAGMVKGHDVHGHDAFLLGEISRHGWWYYFPVVFFFKTPLPFLVLVLWGIVLLVRRRERLEIVLIPIALMLAVMPSSINIGIRHILPIYAPLCIVAAYAAIAIWRRNTDLFGRAALAALLGWLFIGVAAAHPDYLPWFNEAAGDHPENIVVDSNLDWGQDALRLFRAVNDLNIDRYKILYFGNTDLARHRQPADAAMPWIAEPGWYVMSETALKLDPSAREGGYDWLTRTYRPLRQVGKSMRIYRVP